MNFESSVLGTLLTSDVDDEVVAISVQFETVNLLKLFTIIFESQTKEVRCLSCRQNHTSATPKME